MPDLTNPPPPNDPRYNPPPPPQPERQFQSHYQPVANNAVQQRPHKPYELKRTMGRIAWVSAAVVLVLAVLAFAFGRGFSLSASNNGPSVKVDAPLAGEASQQQIDRSQGELEAEVARANEQLEQDTSAASVTVAGDWFVGSLPGSYFIEQVGASATITEFDGFGNITAVGEGTLSGDSFTFNYVNAAGLSGFGQLTLDQAGTSLSGFFEDDFGRRPAQLSRF